MTKSLSFLMLGFVLLAACDSNNTVGRGIASLGADFSKAFNQDRNDTPFDADEISLKATPTIEPFNP